MMLFLALIQVCLSVMALKVMMEQARKSTVSINA